LNKKILVKHCVVEVLESDCGIIRLCTCLAVLLGGDELAWRTRGNYYSFERLESRRNGMVMLIRISTVMANNLFACGYNISHKL